MDYEILPALSEASEAPESEELSVIRSMLLSGIPLQQVGEARGLTEEELLAISEDTAFISSVKSELLTQHTNRAKTNALIDELELTALNGLVHKIPNMDAGQLLATFKTLNGAERKDLLVTAQRKTILEEAVGEEIVQLNVLPTAAPTVEQNSRGEIIAVNGQDTRTITLENLREEVKDYEQTEQAQSAKDDAYITSPIQDS